MTRAAVKGDLLFIFKKNLKWNNNRKATLEFNNLCFYSAWDSDCCCKLYKCSLSFIFFCLDFSLRLAKGINLKEIQILLSTKSNLILSRF